MRAILAGAVCAVMAFSSAAYAEHKERGHDHHQHRAHKAPAKDLKDERAEPKAAKHHGRHDRLISLVATKHIAISLHEMGCSAYDSIKLAKGGYKVDDARCTDGSYDIYYSDSFEVSKKRKQRG